MGYYCVRRVRGDTVSRSVCNFCGQLIPLLEFEKGRAVVLLKKTYCRKCMERAIRQKTKNPKETGKHTAETPR